MQGAKGSCISHREEWLPQKRAPLSRKKNERCGEAPGVKPERAWAMKNRAEGEIDADIRAPESQAQRQQVGRN